MVLSLVTLERIHQRTTQASIMVAHLDHTDRVKATEPGPPHNSGLLVSCAPREAAGPLTSLALPPRPSAEHTQLDPETRATLERELNQVSSEFAQRGKNLLAAETMIRRLIPPLTFTGEWCYKATISALAATYTYSALNPPNSLPLSVQLLLQSGELTAMFVALAAHWAATYLCAEVSRIDAKWEKIFPLMDREKELRQQLGLPPEDTSKESA